MSKRPCVFPFHVVAGCEAANADQPPVGALARRRLRRLAGGYAVFVRERLVAVDGRGTRRGGFGGGGFSDVGAQPLLFGLLDVVPLHAFGPRALAFIPGATYRFPAAVGHVERDILKPVVSWQDSRREVDR